MSTITLSNLDVNRRKNDFLKFLKGCKEEKEREETEKFTKKEEKVEKTARLNPVEEIKTDEQKNEYCRIKNSEAINKNLKNKQVKKKLCISKTAVDCTIKKGKCVPKAPQVNVEPPEPPPQKISEEEIKEKSKQDVIKYILNNKLQLKDKVLKDEYEALTEEKLNELDMNDLRDLVERILNINKDDEEATEPRKKVKEIESELEKKQQSLECRAFAGPAACENEKGTDGLRKCEYEQPGGPCKEIEGEQRRKFLTYQYNEEQEIKGKGWVKFDKLEQDKSYLPVQNGLSGPLKKIPYNIEYAVHVFEDGYYFDGQYKEKSVLDKKYKGGTLFIHIQWGSKRDDPIKINVNNIYFSTLSGLGLYKNEFIENFQKKAIKARQAAIDKGAIDKANDNILIAEKVNIPLATEIDNSNELHKKIKDLNQEHENKLKELKNDQIKALQNLETKDKETLEQVKLEHKKQLEKTKNDHEKQLKELKDEAKFQQKELERKLIEAKESKINDVDRQEQIKILKDLIERKNDVIQKAEQQTKKLEETRSENQKAVIELMKIKEEEKRKQKEEFLKDKGKALETAIGDLENDEKFTNMSEIKIAGLEDYPTLHKKIKNFLVFKEDELIKAHHAKFYSDNIKRNNEKLVETLKLVPSEPFLGIEGLPLVSGFGNDEEKKEEEKEINLKVVKKKVREFIIGRAKYIFNYKEHHQLSVKEYLKTL